jgi:hypothetical protein
LSLENLLGFYEKPDSNKPQLSKDVGTVDTFPQFPVQCFGYEVGTSMDAAGDNRAPASGKIDPPDTSL